MKRFLDRRLSLRHLRTIDAIDRCGSLSQAALTLGITQPALSRSLQEAENIFGFRLFERHARGMSRQALADMPLRVARDVLAQLRRLEEELSHVAGDAQDSASIGVLPSALALLSEVLAQVSGEHPEIKLRTIEGRMKDLLVKLDSGVIDIIVGTLNDCLPSQFDGEQLYVEPLAVVAREGHPVFTESGSREDLRQYGVIWPASSLTLWPEIEPYTIELGFDCDKALCLESVSCIREMLHSTDRVAIVPILMFRSDIRRRALRLVQIDTNRRERPGGIIRVHGRRYSPAVRLVERSVRDHVEMFVKDGSLSAEYLDCERPDAATLDMH